MIELGLKSNDVMIDIGAGTGDFSIPALKIVGTTGKVIAIDTSEAMLLELRKRIGSLDAQNLSIIQSQEYDLMVGDNSADFALICTVLHEIEDKITFLGKVRNVVKLGGRLAIVEWAKKPMDQGPPLQDRIEKSEVAALVQQTGFHEIHLKDFNDFFYYVKAIK